MARLAILSAVILGAIVGAAAGAIEEEVVNCNEVVSDDRCACNARIDRALNEMRTVFSEGDTGPSDIAIREQQERQYRLRTFRAPDCRDASDPAHLPGFAGVLPKNPVVRPLFLKPVGAKLLDQSSAGRGSLLEGRWRGWESLAGQRPRSVSLEIIQVDATHVKACSERGMLFGTINEGRVEFLRPASLALAHQIMLWPSGPGHYRDLEGLVMLREQPDHEVVVGLIWLSRSPKFPGVAAPTHHSCQDRPLEDEQVRSQFRILEREIRELTGSLRGVLVESLDESLELRNSIGRLEGDMRTELQKSFRTLQDSLEELKDLVDCAIGGGCGGAAP